MELAISVAPDVPDDLNGDQGKLRQVLVNLVHNAVKFSPVGHVDVSVFLDSSTPADRTRLVFRVEDDGIGIPADKLNAIFESFFQADNSVHLKYGGTGLGLAISKRLAQLMGGRHPGPERAGQGLDLHLPGAPRTGRSQPRRSEPACGPQNI